ncbi:malto-oligosyltrehalose trehalohydrolase [Ohtaekwangia kribbensis]|uniref:Malto-oligosyltrehalose trehalohydrolase n=1 Tax=Ohtaekwangia kribbensis TaxID=688913 RepID=A0ABW3JXK9_9BACT
MVNPLNINRRSIGVNFTANNEAEILLWAPMANKASIRLLDSNRMLALKKQEFGYWHLHTTQLQTGELYSFVLDEKLELPDPASLAQPGGVHGPSQAVNLNEFQWTDQAWINPPLEEYIFYEVHIGTFSERGTFRGLEKKIPHLKSLGINAIEIMPVAQFPGERNWGYDGVFPFAVQHSYGGAKDLQHLVNVCHNQGIAVVLDVVYNHFGPEGNYVHQYAPYFTDKYKTPWGMAVNFDDAWCDGVRHYFIENALMWFRDFHVDALRLDAVHAIKDFSPVHILREIHSYTDSLIRQQQRNHYMVVELDLNDTRYINSVDKGGYGMDAQWIDEFHHALRVTAGGEGTGYYSDFEGVKHLAKAYCDAYVYDGIYSTHRHRKFGVKAAEHPGSQFIVFSQNHDHIGNRMLGERTSVLVSFEMQKLLAGAVLVSPYIPLLFMGEEYGETNPFLYFVSHGDPELVENVRKGRKAEFAAFHIADEAPDPQAEETFAKSKLQWDLPEKDHHKILFDYYRALIALRRQLPALHRLDRKQLEVSHSEANKTLQLHRWHNNQHVLCLMNFSNAPQTISVTTGQRWKRVFDSADPQWSGPAASADLLTNISVLTLQPESIVIYTSNYV